MGEFLSAFGLSAYKFIYGITLGVSLGLNAFLALSISLSGALFSILIIIILEQKLAKYFLKERDPHRKRRFKGLRLRERFQNAGSLTLISALTPILIPLPVGTLLALSLGFKPVRVGLFMIGSCIIWGLLVISLLFLFDIDLTAVFKIF